MTVSVIIPNLHSPIIDKVVRALLAQEYQGQLEIIVVGLDKFNLLAKFKGKKQVKIINTRRPVIPSIARNIGIKKAKGDYLFFLDADCLPSADWVSQLLKNYKQGNKRVVGGSMAIEKSGNFWRFCDNLSHFYAVSSKIKKGKLKELNSANLSFPHGVIKKVGLFNESLATGEDKELLLRIMLAGYPLIFEPAAAIIHLPERNSFISILRHSFSWGLNSIKVRIRYSEAEKTPFFMKNLLTLGLMTPIIALGATARVFTRSPYHLLYLPVLPIIYFSKIAWCLGALAGLREL